MGDVTGIMVCGHGSRDKAAIREFTSFAEALQDHFCFLPATYGFLEFARPVIADGLDALRDGGVTQILAVPAMLFAAGHVKNDLPSALNAWQARHADVTVRFGRELGIDTRLIRVAGERVRAALATADARRGRVPLEDTLLMTVGRGTSDPDANSAVAKVSRLLLEGLGCGWGETCYSGVTFPLVGPGLEHAARLGYRRIVVFPYFLFTGVLVRRIRDTTRRVAARHPDIQFVSAPHLGNHPLVVETLAGRVMEITAGTGNMNCQLCKYRQQVLGFEDEVGLRQQGHHHHVEGIGTDVPGGHDHGHDHGHHHPYPHAGHRHGPASLRRDEAG